MAVELHAVQDGDPSGPAVVLAPSLGSNLTIWEPQVAALARTRRVIRYDLRGHGASPSPRGPYTLADLGEDAVALLDLLGLKRVTFVGTSLGAMVGMWVAAHHGERIDRLVLCCTSARLGPAQGWTDRAALVREQGTGAVAETVVGRWVTPGYAAREPGRVAALRAMVAATPAEGYASCCEAIRDMDVEGVLHRITAPTLVIAAAQDPATPPEHAERIVAAIPDARLVMVDDAAHLANVEQPEAVTAAILHHLNPQQDRVARGLDQQLGVAVERGRAVRREVLGDAYVDRAADATTAFTAPFQDYIERAAWGEVWARPGLDRRTRSALTLALLTALHAEHEFALHVRGAVRNGLSAEEIAEVLLHTAVYAGVPAANRAFAIAQATLAELGALPQSD